MVSDDLRQLMITAYEAFGQGDRSFIINLLADDIVWTMHGPRQAFPAPTVLNGKAEVVAALRKIDEALLVERNQLLTLMVDGDQSATLCERHVLQRQTGRRLIYKVATFYRFRDGKLVEYQSFYDSFDMLKQVIGREIDIPTIYPE